MHLQTSIVRLQQHALVAIAGEGKAGWRAVGVKVWLNEYETLDQARRGISFLTSICSNSPGRRRS